MSSGGHDDERERLLRDDTAADALLRWAQRHDDALAEAIALARLGPDAARWERIVHRADALDDTGRARLDAALAGWPDAMRIADEWWVWPEVEPQLALARTVMLEPLVNEPDPLQLLADSAHAASLTALTVKDLSSFEDWQVESLLRSPHLRGLESLRLQNCHLDASHLAALGNAPLLARLRELDRGGNDLGVEGVRVLASAPGLTKLTALSLDSCWIDDEGLRILLEAPFAAQLTTLSLACNRITDAGLRTLADAAHLSRLEHLDISENTVNWRRVHELAHLTRLAYLNIRDNPSDGWDEFDLDGVDHYEVDRLLTSSLVSSLRELEMSIPSGVQLSRSLARVPTLGRLERLVLTGGRIDPDDARALVAASNLPALRHLELTNNALGDKGTIALAQASAGCRLEHLAVTNNRLGDAGAAALARAKGLVGVTHLDQSSNQIGPDGVRALLEREAPWRKLVLSGNPIGDEGARIIAASPQAAALERGDLDCAGFTNEGRQALGMSPYLRRSERLHWLMQLPEPRLEALAAERGLTASSGQKDWLTALLDAVEDAGGDQTDRDRGAGNVVYAEPTAVPDP